MRRIDRGVEKSRRASYPMTLSPRHPDTPTPLLPKLDHAARDLAPAHGIEAVVDLLQPDAGRHQLVELQAAAQVKIDVARHVDAEAVRAHVRTLDLLLIQKLRSG